MARWEPDARERLVRAALDLFAEQGYDDTTVVQIAERASPRTRWPRLMSSGTTAEPIQPEAPVTNMRMEFSLVDFR